MDEEKFKTLVHYICSRCQDNPARLGATKLNKVLWYAETSHFLKTGRPLTGAKYLKRQYGPVPEGMLQVVDELVHEQKIFVRDVQFFEREKKEYISLKEPDIDSFFSASDIREIDRIIDAVCEMHTARSISRQSHNESWHLAEIGEGLPLYTILANPGELTEADAKWADEKIAKMGR